MLRMMKYPELLPRSCPLRRSERGFTLHEVLVVIMIMALLLAIGYPILWRSRVRARLLSEVRMVRQAATVARINAVKQSRRVAMKFLDDAATQEGGLMVAWVDDNADGVQTAGEQEIGRWLVRNGFYLSEDSGNGFFKLAASGQARGVVFLPTGTTIVNSAGEIGAGQAGVVLQDVASGWPTHL